MNFNNLAGLKVLISIKLHTGGRKLRGLTMIFLQRWPFSIIRDMKIFGNTLKSTLRNGRLVYFMGWIERAATTRTPSVRHERNRMPLQCITKLT